MLLENWDQSRTKIFYTNYKHHVKILLLLKILFLKEKTWERKVK